jgi:DNA-binding Lrp family transcriptional regulator
MPMRRENVAAALKYLQDKADLRGRLQRATSLDPQEQDLADIAVETGASFIPGVGPALAARDFERARRADDEAGMAMAAASAIPGERLAKLLGKFDPTRLELDVYHGTPHRFEPTEANPLGEFDASKIGTGEGAQAYGHGIYYAESPDVAESYRVGTTFAQKPNRDIAEMLYSQKSGDADAAIASLKSEIKQLEKQGIPEGYKEQYDFALQKLQEFKKNPPEGGSLYKADLPDEMIDRMLDWDKPLSEQPAVLAAIKNLPEVKTLVERGQKFENLTGQNFYKLISDSRSHGYRDASSGFKSAGIPGIKYADAGSRGQGGSGTRNFVVFPGEEKKVRILERK